MKKKAMTPPSSEPSLIVFSETLIDPGTNVPLPPIIMGGLVVPFGGDDREDEGEDDESRKRSL